MSAKNPIRWEALERGDPHYFTGVPCTRGHISVRNTKTKACLECVRLATARNRERGGEEIRRRNRAYSARWKADNPEQAKEHRLKWHKDHPECGLKARRKYKAKNRHLWIAYDAKRRAAELNATPPWANAKPIADMYALAAELTKSTGVGHDVDHIIPLQHPLVCGLHVADNLQVITSIANRKKSNKFSID